MDHDIAISVDVSSDVPAEERQALLLALQTTAEVQKPTSRTFGLEWVTFVAFVKDVGSVAAVASALIKLAEQILSWRKKVRERGIPPAVRLSRPQRPPLDLEVATDDKVIEWLSQQ